MKFDDISVIFNRDRYYQKSIQQLHRIIKETKSSYFTFSFRLNKSQRHLNRNQKSFSEISFKITSLNHRIASHDKAISTLNLLFYRFKINKKILFVNSVQRIHDFTRKNEYLHEEFTMYKNVNRAVKDLKVKIKKAH